MKKKTILISGGAGLIGSHLCEKLLNKKNTIICIDNLFTGSKNNLKKFISQVIFENTKNMSNKLPMLGLVAAGILSALMSSLSSVFNSCSTLITWDIYKKYNVSVLKYLFLTLF